MSQDLKTIERQLPGLRRYGALLLGSKPAADDRIERILKDLSSTAWRQLAEDRTLLYEMFFAACSSEPSPALQLTDFRESDHRHIAALNKMSLEMRGLMLLSTAGPAFSEDRVATILGVPVRGMSARLMSASRHFAAALQDRLCVIVEDDLIAMSDLEAEISNKGFGVAGTAKNQQEAFDLVDEVKPDIGIIDLALPEGMTAGAEIAKRLRERFASKIVFVTAFAGIAEQVAGPNDKIVSKPWSPATLNRAMVATAS